MLRPASLLLLALLVAIPRAALGGDARASSTLSPTVNPLVRVGDVLEVLDETGATVGYGFAAAGRHYWRLPTRSQRPPAPNRRFDTSVLHSNWTLPQFVGLVRNTWQTDDRWMEGRIVEYTSFDAIPCDERDSFFPDASMARQIDTGTTGLYSSGGAGVGVGHRYSDADGYEEYWVLSASYDATAANSFEDGTIPSSLSSWQSGHTAVKVVAVESGTCP